MTKMLNGRKLYTQIIVAFFILAIPVSAQACHWYDAPCKVREAAERLRKRLEQVAAAGENITKSEIGVIRSQTNSAYSKAITEAQDGLKVLKDNLNAILAAGIEAILRNFGSQFMAANKDMINDLIGDATDLDDEAMAAINRIRRAIPSKKISDQTRTDMITLATKLGRMADATGNAINSTFGIFVSADGAYMVGAGASVGFVMQTYLEKGDKYPRMGVFSSTDGSIGIQESLPGASVGLSWSPGGLDDVTGAFLGFQMEMPNPFIPGAAISLSWDVPANPITGPWRSTPSASITIPIPLAEPSEEPLIPPKPPSVKVALDGGYSKLIERF